MLNVVFDCLQPMGASFHRRNKALARGDKRLTPLKCLQDISQAEVESVSQTPPNGEVLRSEVLELGEVRTKAVEVASPDIPTDIAGSISPSEVDTRQEFKFAEL